ncbi:MAG: hypothetical protein ACYCSW_11235, partial [bacterium]
MGYRVPLTLVKTLTQAQYAGPFDVTGKKRFMRIFEHNRFNNAHNAFWIAKDIIDNRSRGTATAEKIVTVLGHLHKNEGISNLNRIDNTIMENYRVYLQSEFNAGHFVAHTVQGYISALNDISEYINLRTDKNLKTSSTTNDLKIKNKIKYGGKQTPQELYDK